MTQVHGGVTTCPKPGTRKKKESEISLKGASRKKSATPKLGETSKGQQLKTGGHIHTLDARSPFAPAHPAAETPFYIAAASVSARGDAQCVWSHESSISSSYFPLELRRALSHESGLRQLHCSRLLRASCSLQAAARKCSVQVALRKCSEQVALRKCSAPVAPRKRFAHVLCASWSVQVALRLLCASCSAQVL